MPLLAALAVWLLVAPLAWTAPVLPTAIPDTDLGLDPYRHVGLVRTESYGADPTVLGSGWVAGERVVVSAAHVFFVEENLGWNRNRWYWKRAARAGGYWDTSSMMIPRTYRVMAGYAAAAQRAAGDNTKIGDAFNVDQIALLFYRAATDGPPPPRASDALLGAGTYSIIGYPTKLPGQPVTGIRMHGHVGGSAATFTLAGGATDYVGNPNLMARTGDLMTGPGGSGGPVFKRVGGAWTIVGSLLGGDSAYTHVTARAVDASLETMITAAIDDSVAEGPGLFLWETEGSWSNAEPVFRNDGSVLVASNSTLLRAIDAKGAELWRYVATGSSVEWIAEAPDGRVLLGGHYSLIAVEGTTGAELWRSGTPYADRGAVGESGEVYVPGANRMVRISPRGTVDWDVVYPSDNVHEAKAGPPVIGPDNTVYFISQNRLRAINPADGSERWRSEPIANVDAGSLAVGPDGSLTLVSSAGVSRYDSDGSLRWLYATTVVQPARPVVQGDGSVVLVDFGHEGLLIIGPGGTLAENIPLPGYIDGVDIDSAGNLYVARSDGIEALSPARTRLWKNESVVGRLTIGPGGIMIVQGGSPSRITAIGQHAPGAAHLWQGAGGGYDGARRVANAAKVAPRIVEQPRAVRSILGYRLELSVVAEGSTPLTFEWRKDGQLLPDQVGQRLIIRQSAAADAGTYAVTVRNSVGTIVSEPARVEVGTAQFGDVLWTTELRSSVRPAVADDGTVYALAQIDIPTDPYNYAITLVAIDASGNEKWRRELARTGSLSQWAASPIVGDDGRVYVASPGKISAYSATGSLMWSHTWSVTVTGDWPSMSLARDNGVFFRAAGVLGRLSASGQVLWSRSDVSRVVGMQVRRDGDLVVGPGAVVSLAGVPRSSGTVALDGSFGFLGPGDEWVLTTTYDGGVTLDRAGQVVSRNPQSIYDTPLFMLSDGTVVTDRLRLEPFIGTGSSMMGIYGMEPIAVLEGDRLLIRKDTLAQVVDKAGDVLAETTNVPWGAYTVSKRGILVGGWKIGAYSSGWPVSRSPWPLVAADSRNTRRAPADFDLQVSLPSSVKVRGREDPTGAYSPSVAFRDRTMDVYVGYPARLSAAVFGTGPFTFRWMKDGQELAGVTGGEIDITAAAQTHSGAYSVTVTNSAGTLFSDVFILNVKPPEPATPGLYTGTWTSPYGGGTAPCVYRVSADRRLEFWVFGTGNMRGTTLLLPNGSFSYSGVGPSFSGSLVGSTLTLGAGPLTALAVPDTGLAPNGLPAGVYFGYLGGPTAHAVTMLVLADGSFHWMRGESNGWSRTASGVFSAGELTTTLVETSFIGGGTYTISAQADGAIVGRPPDGSTSPGFYAVWTGRPEVERLANLSTRGYVSSGQPPMIAGFVVQGSAPGRLLLRVAGPALRPLGVQEALQQPRLRLVDGAGLELSRNSGWMLDPQAAEIAATARRLHAFAFANQSADSALLATTGAGLFTALVESVDGGSGTALVEVYEDIGDTGGSCRLRNLSTRGTVGQGERVLIGGFVVTGRVPKPLLIRAAGPALQKFVQGAFVLASDPRVRVYRQGSATPLAENDNIWNSMIERDVRSISTRVGAFAFPAGALDSALVLALEPGAYTAVVDNLGTESGVALVEIYEIPAQ